MTEPIADNVFIVISGSNPQKGKAQRLREARSHITKEHFRKLHGQEQHRRQRKRQHRVLSALPCPSGSEKSRDHIQVAEEISVRIPPEVHAAVPFTSSPFLDPDCIGAKMALRVKQFFEVHMQTSEQHRPYVGSVICWAVETPHFMSAKLLRASAWDDMRDSGKLSEWTVQQRCITSRLLNDSFRTGTKINMLLAVSTIQLLLEFELLMGNNENFCRLQEFGLGIIKETAQPNNKAWLFLATGLSLVEQANCLRLINANKHISASSQEDLASKLPLHSQATYPIDLSLFTFRQPRLTEDDYLVYILLSDLYHVVCIATNFVNARVSQPTYDYIASQQKRMIACMEEVPGSNGEPRNIEKIDHGIDPIILPLRLSILLVSSCLILGTETDRIPSLTALASRLRRTMSGSGLDRSSQFPGALVWCYAIGARFSNTDCDQRWFLVQFLRSTLAWMAEALEILLKNVKTIVGCMEIIGQLSIEDVV